VISSVDVPENDTPENDVSEGDKYRAPALEKGLDIIELLSRTYEPLTATQICERLQRSKAELYRMLHVLESRQYIECVNGRDEYVITRKLLTLGTERQPFKDLLEFSAPLMRKISEKTNQGVHVAVQSGDQIVVIARSESVGMVGYSVRVGYRKPLVSTASGRVLFAFQSPEIKESWLTLLRPTLSDEELDVFLSDVRKVQQRGYDQAKSMYVKGITDLSVPIVDNKYAIATLTIPFIEQTPAIATESEALEALKNCAELISNALKLGYIKAV
jgi:DNA-binding IclR family transcriptional regulator